MNKTLIVILILAVIAIVSALYYFLVYIPAQAGPSIMDGSPCKIGGKIPGTVKNGTCVPNVKEGSISI